MLRFSFHEVFKAWLLFRASFNCGGQLTQNICRCLGDQVHRRNIESTVEPPQLELSKELHIFVEFELTSAYFSRFEENLSPNYDYLAFVSFWSKVVVNKVGYIIHLVVLKDFSMFSNIFTFSVIALKKQVPCSLIHQKILLYKINFNIDIQE